MKIGIVSGIGPLAGSDILSKLFEYAATVYGAHEDHDYPDVILRSHGINGVDKDAHLSDWFKEGIIASAKDLESWGCNVIGIACNTAHAYIDELSVSSATVVNLLETVATSAQPGPTYGLLTSRGTRETSLYDNYLDSHGISYIHTTDDQQQLLDTCIDHVMGHQIDQAAELLAAIINQMKQSGLTHFILGCTELPIALRGVHTDATIIDSNFILAKNLVDSYFSQKQNQ